jgi:hypothetical protein
MTLEMKSKIISKLYLVYYNPFPIIAFANKKANV